jgi:hypothetical protein
MAEAEDQEITGALAKLAEQDAEAASDAEAALEWIAWEQRLSLVTQERIQTFCWYELPMKWLTTLDHKVRVAGAVARALDLLGLPRYAAICRSDATRGILGAYEASTEEGKAAFRRAAAASGIQPPDLPEFEWGAAMGPEEASAGEEGFRESRTGEPPGEQDVGWALHHTINLCLALGLLAVGGDWADRSYELTGAGKATALEALRARATGPRTLAWT